MSGGNMQVVVLIGYHDEVSKLIAIRSLEVIREKCDMLGLVCYDVCLSDSLPLDYLHNVAKKEQTVLFDLLLCPLGDSFELYRRRNDCQNWIVNCKTALPDMRDKVFSKQLASQVKGLAIPDDFPVIDGYVLKARYGSHSVGLEFFKDYEEAKERLSFQHDFILEPKVTGTEIHIGTVKGTTIGAFFRKSKDPLTLSLKIEGRRKADLGFDGYYKAPDVIADRLEHLDSEFRKHAGNTGMCRNDYIYNEDTDTFYFLESNIRPNFDKGTAFNLMLNAGTKKMDSNTAWKEFITQKTP